MAKCKLVNPGERCIESWVHLQKCPNGKPLSKVELAHYHRDSHGGQAKMT